MLRDPFYRQILEALDGLDPQVFERCMGDLLRSDFPGLVPVPGGGDSGFDGVIPDAEGAFPLVCTTAKDVERNLAGSLDSVSKRGWPARRVALATSQALTPQQRLGLFDKAQEKGFRLMQVLDRSALADRLYRNRRWCKELLHLDGRPSPLSLVPLTFRPLVDLEPIGRKRDLEWLEAIDEDRVLAGEPGSGKTHLLRHLMLRDWPALFLVSQSFDSGAIRDALGDLQPRIVVVDDAHSNPSDLVRLVQLRRETGASFHIVATTWKGGQDEIVAKLDVSPAQVHCLELLTRDEIVQVFRDSGVRTDDDTLRLLVNQASNRPGLAVTIASLWLQGRWNELNDGTALSRNLLAFFHDFVGRESTDVLAAFSLGGDRGMTLHVVSEFLGLSRYEVRRIADGLAAGGALREVDGETLAVWPRELRNPLLRAVFFPDSAVKHPYRELLERVPNLQSATSTLVSARLFGAPVPLDHLRALVGKAGSADAWRGLAYLSETDALWVLEYYPGDLVYVAEAALVSAAEATVARLLQRAETAAGEPHSHTNHPIRILQRWSSELSIPADELVRRRKLLVKMSKKYLQGGGLRSVGLQGICLALSPSLEGHSSDPGMGKTITLRSRLLHLEQLREMETLWAEAQSELSTLETEDWHHLSSVLWSWIHPNYASKGRPVPEETERFMRSFAGRVLEDIAPSAQGKPGLAARVKELALQVGVALTLEPSPDFELLFPSMDSRLKNRESWEAEWQTALARLASQWAIREPSEIAQLLARYEREAQKSGRASFPRGDLEVCRKIAAQTEALVPWLDALLDQEASGVSTGPFLERMIEVRKEGWELQAERFLGLERQHAWSAVEAILRIPAPPASLLEKALRRLGELPQLLEGLCLSRQVDIENLRTLLNHPQWELALTAAVGEWNADTEGGVQAAVAADWRAAILRGKTNSMASEEFRDPSREYWLGVILASDSDLAFDWLAARLQDSEKPSFISGDTPFGLAIAALSKDQRLQLVDTLRPGLPAGFLGLLAGKDFEVFAKVLEVEALRSHHLEPLGLFPDERWMELALLALDASHEVDEVVAAALWPSAQIRIMSGTGLEEWKAYENAFARFETDPRDRVREVARRGRQLAAEQRQEAEQREREFAIHGRYQ